MLRESSKGVEGSGAGMVTKGAKQTFLKVQVRDAALCLVGLACYWPLIRRSTYQGAFPQEAFFLVLSLAAVATALVVISLASPLRRAAERRSVVWLVLPIASTALAAALSFGLVGSAAGWLWVVAAILYGATLAVLTVIWGNRLVGHSLRGACVIVLVSFSLGVLLSLVCSLWGDIASGIAVWLAFCQRRDCLGSRRFVCVGRSFGASDGGAFLCRFGGRGAEPGRPKRAGSPFPFAERDGFACQPVRPVPYGGKRGAGVLL